MVEFDPVLVHGWLERAAARRPGKKALVCGSRALTYHEVDELSTRLAWTLNGSGYRPGDRAVVLLENSLEAVVSIYGILKAGGVFIVADPDAPAVALARLLHDCGAGTIIAHDDNKNLVRSACREIRNCAIIWVGRSGYPDKSTTTENPWENAVSSAAPPRALPHVLDVDLAALIYTSGSTGRSKGIMCSHHNMVSAARSIIQYLGNSSDDIILDALPLSFDYGLYQVLMSVMFEGTIVLEKSAGYIAPLIDRIEQEKVTGLPLVPSLSAMFLRLKRFPKEKLASLRYITNTGALWPESHIRMFREKLPHVKIFSMYGLTECKRVAFLPPELIDSRPDSVGKPMPNCEADVVDGIGSPVRPGETGELVVRGSNVMQGYWNDPELTRLFFRNGRWPADRRLYTGDLFRLDGDGFLYFAGRKDDLVKCSGRRVSLREVEDALTSVAGVEEACVVAVPDDLAGNVMAAFVSADKSRQADAADLRTRLEQMLEPYKIPRYIWFLNSLPRTPNGKVDRKKLQDEAQELARQGG